MSRVLPILFNTDMVRAILRQINPKTVTRRAVKYKYSNTEMKMRTDKYGTRLIEIQKDIEGETHGKYPDGRTWHKLLPYIEKKPPCRKGDILYVRETWCEFPKNEFHYLADFNTGRDKEFFEAITDIKWHPSIHMPKEAARIWLKVTDVKVERLRDITNEQILKEGASKDVINRLIGQMPEKTEEYIRIAYLTEWSWTWDATIKIADIECYGWDANPWVWVIEFEPCEKTDNGK